MMTLPPFPPSPPSGPPLGTNFSRLKLTFPAPPFPDLTENSMWSTKANYFIEAGMISTAFLFFLMYLNDTNPSVFAKIVKSLPIPVLSPE